MQTVCLSGRHSQELLAIKVCHLPLCSTRKPSRISDQSSKLVAALRCEADANPSCTYLASTRRSCLLTQAAAFLPLCSAREPSRISDQSSKLAAALRREADANCLRDWPALGGGACHHRLPAFLPLCCARAPSRISEPVEQACTSSLV